MNQLRSQRLDSKLVHVSSRAGVGYTLNRDYAIPLRKVEGEPGIDSGAPVSHAAREALVALQIASQPQVKRVLLGDAAYSYIYPHGGPKRKNCDVIGVLDGNRGVILGEGKGTQILDSLGQVGTSAKALSQRGTGGVVRSVLVVAQMPLYLACPPGFSTVSEATGRWKLSAPGLDYQFSAVLQTANSGILHPLYDYLVLKEGAAGPLNGLGVAVSTIGDDFLYTNRPWSGGGLSSAWGPIRKLKLPETDAAGINIAFTSEVR